MRILAVFFLLWITTSLVVVAQGGEDGEMRDTDQRRKFAGGENDPIFRALGALKDERLEDAIVEAAQAFYSSQFADAHARIAAIMAKYPESAIGRTLYDFLLLMDGASLGFSGKCGPALATLNRLQVRMENGSEDTKADDLAGVMSLKIDILETCGETNSAVSEMDALIDRFGSSDLPSVRWRVESAMQRKALTLEQSGMLEQAVAAYKSYVEKLRSNDGAESATEENLKKALRKLEELQRGGDTMKHD